MYGSRLRAYSNCWLACEMDILYRLGQLWHNMTAQPLSQPELKEITNNLTHQELSLFRQMSQSDQQHAYRVFRLLRDSGQVDVDLLAAALLHDVGKVRGDLSAWDRSIVVLGETFAPQRAKQWGNGDESGWERAFVVREQHAAWGAALAKNVGSRPGVVDLIKRHQDPLPVDDRRKDERLMLLRWADDQN